MKTVEILIENAVCYAVLDLPFVCGRKGFKKWNIPGSARQSLEAFMLENFLARCVMQAASLCYKDLWEKCFRGVSYSCLVL